MRKLELIRLKAERIQAQIVCCVNEQPTDEGVVWIFGSRTSVSDLLMDLNVPEDIQDEVCNHLRCPKCDSPLKSWDDVGTLHDFQIDHERTVESALRKYESELFAFVHFLNDYPTLGATHRFGRRLLRTLFEIDGSPFPGGMWFRAAVKKKHCNALPPPIIVGDQRYNRGGSPRYYLSNSAKCAAIECLSSKPDARAWVQEFTVGALENVLDLRAWQADDDNVLDNESNYSAKHGLVLTALIFSDLLTLKPDFPPNIKPSQVRAKPEYHLTQFVADAAKLAGFNGVLYHSVRFDADNLVILKEDWRPVAKRKPYSNRPDADDFDYSKRRVFIRGMANILHGFDIPPYTNQTA